MMNSQKKSTLFKTRRYSTTETTEKTKLIEELQKTIIQDIQNNLYDTVVVVSGNFVLKVDDNGTVFPLIPEAYIWANQTITDQDKYTYITSPELNETFDTSFSYLSLQIGMSIIAKLTQSNPEIQTIPLLSADDKYISWVEKQQACKEFFNWWYKAIPSIYRKLIEETLWWAKAAKTKLKIIPKLLKESWQNSINNPFLISEKCLVNRFDLISNKNNILWKEYKNYETKATNGLWQKMSCSLELFHLLRTIKNDTNSITKLTW